MTDLSKKKKGATQDELDDTLLKVSIKFHYYSFLTLFPPKEREYLALPE